jgi:pyruvate kinase
MKRHQGTSARQTRIVATVGVCHDQDWPTYLRKICEAGVDVLRLNMSHCDPDYTKETAILSWANMPAENMAAPIVAIMADLQGPKCRIGKFQHEGLALLAGQHVALVPASTVWNEFAALAVHPDPLPLIPVPEPLGQTLLAGLRQYLIDHDGQMPSILFGDGDIVVEVVAVRDGWVQAVVSAGGVLGSRKGLTVRELDLDLDPFPDKDQRDLKFCLQQGVDAVALSFVRSPGDVERVRAFIAEHAPQEVERVRLIAKIETLSAIRHIDAILQACDGIMIARGDLGLQLGVEEVPMTQKQLIVAARKHGKPCIVATQMLESMITNPVPTRAEATDVFNAILDGGDAVMLSGETSVGSRPYLVVATMDRIARKAEMYRLQDRARRPPITLPPLGDHNHIERTNEQFAKTAVLFAENVPARAIVCFTRTGRTPERISRHRPPVPVLAFCSSPRVARTSLLYWGLHPILMLGVDTDKTRLSMMVEEARAILRRDYGMGRGDAIVVTAGIDWPKGGTNVLQVLIEDHDAAAQLIPPEESV